MKSILKIDLKLKWDLLRKGFIKWNFVNKIGFINYHELRMAGLSETSVMDSDNFLIKDKNSFTELPLVHIYLHVYCNIFKTSTFMHCSWYQICAWVLNGALNNKVHKLN